MNLNVFFGIFCASIILTGPQSTAQQQGSRKFRSEFKNSDKVYHQFIRKNCKFIPSNGLNSRKVLRGFISTDRLSFIDSWGDTITAPVGTFTDGASLPDIKGFLPGDKYADDVLLAAWVHDAYCQIDNETRKPPYRTRPQALLSQDFYEGCIFLNMKPSRAKMYYAAVYLYGPDWPTKDDGKTENTFNAIMFPGAINEALILWQLSFLKGWIKKAKPNFWQVMQVTHLSKIFLKNGKIYHPPTKIELERIGDDFLEYLEGQLNQINKK